ncbi:Peroxiredoxin [Halanaeroarchaeum sp. HSR-CO]|uniref:redoxin domain-containing protein n=1 Tax=Halanaeroarchaeum sp. HSR-CO TaxID=2866382 RepID=UPI00217EEB2C|nr:redoxin domain-containing protein [Halanaeroarchaeum sp. HSR-CO]UWG46376.1 Peroxiredoxin [Halanaeroarchaeum sp. HSR-CO]
MVTEGDAAPDFTVPRANGAAYNDVEPFTLSDHLGSGPVNLAFYPAAFTNGCTAEMCSFRDSMHEFDSVNASVYGISVDLPFAQNVWIQEHDLNFPMLSDWTHEVIHEYDVVDPAMYDMIEVAERSVFVLDERGTVAYRWVRDGDNPDFDRFVDDLYDVVASVSTS